jgi:hypothetical protein
MHAPPAVGALIDRGVSRTREMRGDVEGRGESARGATVAARGVPQFVERDGRLSLVGFRPAVANIWAAVGVVAGRLPERFVNRLAGR